MQLHDGDFTLQKSFSLVQTTSTGGRLTGQFKAEKGNEYVTMLVGEVKVGEQFDLDKMMAKIGLVCDDKGAKEILMLKEEIAELKKQLAEAIAAKAA